MSKKVQATGLMILLVFTASVYWIEQPFHKPVEPDPAAVEAMLGRDPGPPEHKHVSVARVLWRRATLSFETGLPFSFSVPRSLTGDFWTYRFPVDEAYAPPSPRLNCNIDSGLPDMALYCRHSVRRDGMEWTYTLSRLSAENRALFVIKISDTVDMAQEK